MAQADPFHGVLQLIATADARSFHAAARQLGVTPSAISKAIAKLEAELGVRLLRRTSRSVSTTPEGEAFLERCREALGQMLAAREVASETQRAPRGRLRLSLPLALGRLLVMPALSQLLSRHPLLSLEITLTDRFVRLAEEGIDLAVRIGTVKQAALVRRPLRAVRWVTVGAPDYLARRGTPHAPSQLAGHNCLRFVLSSGRCQDWVFRARDSGRALDVAVEGNLIADDGMALIQSSAAGLGLVQAHDYMVAGPLARGELIEVLREHAAEGPPISAVMLPGRQRSPKVRAAIDFLVALTRGEPSS